MNELSYAIQERDYLEQSKKQTEELKTEWLNFLKEDTERYYPNKYKKFWE